MDVFCWLGSEEIIPIVNVPIRPLPLHLSQGFFTQNRFVDTRAPSEIDPVLRGATQFFDWISP